MIHTTFKFTAPAHSGIKALICLLIVYTCLFNSGNAFGQDDFKPKLGVIDRASIEMVKDTEDSTAEAVVLYDYGEVKFSYIDRIGMVMTMKYWKRIKIIKESALDRASVSILYGNTSNFKKDESISEISAYTYNMVGNNIETIPLTRKSVVREKVSEKYWSCKFNLQNVRKGSVIEYCYTKITPLQFQDKPDTWTFQGDIPFKWSEYKITIPNSLYYKISMAGYLPFHITKKKMFQLMPGMLNSMAELLLTDL